MSTESNPVDGFRDAVGELVGELGSLLPRLVERSRDQLAIAAKLVEQLPCAGFLGARGSSPESEDSTPDLRLVPGGIVDESDDEEVAPRLASATRPARKAPAKRPATKAAAKKAPAKRPATKAAARKAPAKKAPAKRPATKAMARKAPATRPATPVARVAPQGLAIPDYDELAASQVIPRLDNVTPDELEAIRVHEVGHRQRRTILSRVAQLQTS